MRRLSARKEHGSWRHNADGRSVKRWTSAKWMHAVWQLTTGRGHGRAAERRHFARGTYTVVATAIKEKGRQGTCYAWPQPTLTGQGE